MRQVKAGEEFEVEDMIRFNEAIDQALAESISSYAAAVQASPDVFLGVLGHDLRTPLSAILLGADVLLRTDELGTRATKIASRIYASVKRASNIVGDLLDFTRSQIGGRIPVNRLLMDIAPACERIIDESRAVNPEAHIVVTIVESAAGEFDGGRLEQVFSNLIGNAVQHGADHSPVTVTLDKTDDTVQFCPQHGKGHSQRCAALYIQSHGALFPRSLDEEWALREPGSRPVQISLATPYYMATHGIQSTLL